MKSGRIFIWVFLVLVLLFLFLSFFGSTDLLQPIIILFAGWFAFLVRVLPQMTINWSGIGMVVVCSVLVVFGMQWLCQWLYAHWVRQGAADADVRWRWTWTASLYGAVWLLFLAAMGATGLVHQVGWLATMKEPLYMERHSRSLWRMFLSNYSKTLSTLGDSEEWKLAETRREFEMFYPANGRQPNPQEALHVIYLEGSSNKLAAAILFYRDPRKRDQTGFMLITPEKREEEFKMDQFQTVLARYEH